MFTSTGGQQLATAVIADMADANLGTKNIRCLYKY